jgi:hypothetical protein
MKHNLLSVSQMCDQGHKLTFDSEKYEIRKEGSGKLVDTAARTSNNIYVLSVMQEHHSNVIKCQPTSTSAACIQWRGEAQPSHFQISNLNLMY